MWEGQGKLYGWKNWTVRHPVLFWIVLILLMTGLGLSLPVGPGFWAAAIVSGVVWHVRALAVLPRGRIAGSRRKMARPSLDALPASALPQLPYVLLPRGQKIQVTKEERHLGETEQLLANNGGRPVAATLHRLIPASSRSTRDRVQVRIDGLAVGELTTYMSEHFLPVITACDAQRVIVACHAAIRGNQLKVDVVLDTTKAIDLTDDWIAKHVLRPGGLGAEHQ